VASIPMSIMKSDAEKDGAKSATRTISSFDNKKEIVLA